MKISTNCLPLYNNFRNSTARRWLPWWTISRAYCWQSAASARYYWPSAAPSRGLQSLGTSQTFAQPIQAETIRSPNHYYYDDDNNNNYYYNHYNNHSQTTSNYWNQWRWYWSWGSWSSQTCSGQGRRRLLLLLLLLWRWRGRSLKELVKKWNLNESISRNFFVW